MGREVRARAEGVRGADAPSGAAAERGEGDGGSSLADPVELPGRVPVAEEGEGEPEEDRGDAGEECEARVCGGRD